MNKKVKFKFDIIRTKKGVALKPPVPVISGGARYKIIKDLLGEKPYIVSLENWELLLSVYSPKKLVQYTDETFDIIDHAL